MFNKHRQQQFETYQVARKHFCEHPEQLIAIEEFLLSVLIKGVSADIEQIKRDYNEASFLYPFWQHYPPDERGRDPKGDQFPWIEVGEHALGCKLHKYLRDFEVMDAGLPTGADQRFIVRAREISKITEGFTDAAWLHVDIKSVGPRDDQDHTVMSHNQVSGDGVWASVKEGVRNRVLLAEGARASHDFHCSVPPIYVLSNGIIAPVVLGVIKPVYDMLSLKGGDGGQPLSRITFACIPNGILLCENPNYLKKYRGLLFPGKDDKGKDPRKIRARVDFSLLRAIAKWRMFDLKVSGV